MCGRIPLVHGVEQFVALVYNQNRPLCDDSQIGFRYNNCSFDNALFFWIQPGHFKVNPNQTLIIYRHIIHP